MRKLVTIILSILWSVMFIFVASGLSDSTSHDVILQVNEIALIDLNNAGSITLTTNAPALGGEDPAGDTDASKLLQYTSLVAAGLTRNITVEGMFIICQEPLRLNETYQISIKPPNHKNIELACKVVWSNLYGVDDEKTAYGMGFCFVQVADKDRHLLSDAISGHHDI